MNKRVLWFLLIFVSSPVFAGVAKLTFFSPTTRTDGSVLPESEIAYYTVYWGQSSGNFPNTMPVDHIYGLTEYKVCFPLAPGATYYFVVTTSNIYGVSSDFSNEVSKNIPLASVPVGNVDTASAGSALRVDGHDMIYVLKCFGLFVLNASCTAINFNLWLDNGCDLADLDGDGMIGPSDVAIVSSNFGSSQ